MIKISIENKRRRVVVSVSGHAAAAKKGEDIICAAASMLVLTLVEALKKEKALRLEYRLREGDALVTFIRDKRTSPILRTVEYGFSFLAQLYPQYVKTEKGEHTC